MPKGKKVTREVFDKVKYMHEKGVDSKMIAELLGYGYSTIGKLASAETFEEYKNKQKIPCLRDEPELLNMAKTPEETTHEAILLDQIICGIWESNSKLERIASMLDVLIHSLGVTCESGD